MIESNRPNDPMSSYVLHLWSRKWWIIGLTLLAVAAATAVLRSRIAPPVYTATAMLYVKERPFVEQRGNDQRRPLGPPNYRQLLTSDALLDSVREDLAKSTDGEKIVTSVGALRGALNIATEMEVDTTVERAFSPLITVSMRWHDAVGARNVLDVLLRGFIRTYGSMQSEQSHSQAASLKERNLAALDQLKDLEGKRATIQNQLQFRRQLMFFKQAQLAPIAVPQNQTESDVFMPNSGATKMQIDMPTSVPAQIGPGLLAEQASLRQRIALTTDASQKVTFERQLAVNQAEQKMINEEIEGLQKEISALAQELVVLNEQNQQVRTELAIYSRSQAQASMDTPSAQKASALEGADVKVVAAPITPEGGQTQDPTKKIAATGMAVFFILLLLFICEKYLYDARDVAAKTS